MEVGLRPHSPQASMTKKMEVKEVRSSLNIKKFYKFFYPVRTQRRFDIHTAAL